MEDDLIFHAWGITAFIHTFYLSCKLFPHINTGYAIHYWLGLWVYEPKVFDKEGQKTRSHLLIAMALYILIGLLVLPFL